MSDEDYSDDLPDQEKRPIEVQTVSEEAKASQQEDKIFARMRQRNRKLDKMSLRRVLDTKEGDLSAEVREDENTPINPEKKRGMALRMRAEKQRKRKIKIAAYAIGAVLFIWLYYVLFMPFKAGITFGVCKTFLEQQIRYNTHLRYSIVEDFGDSVRIWYRRIDPYGEYRMESMRCHFRYAEEHEQEKYGYPPFIIDRVTRDRRPYYPDRVEAFNRSIQAVIAADPDLIIPAPLPDSLQDLQINVDAFRRIRL